MNTKNENERRRIEDDRRAEEDRKRREDERRRQDDWNNSLLNPASPISISTGIYSGE